MRWEVLKRVGLVTIGAHSYGLPNVLYWDFQTKLKIGKYCSISEGTTFLLGGEHRGDWISTFPFGAYPDQWPSAASFGPHTVSKGDILIGHDVWIGHGVIILSGISIGNGAIIGAGSVVTKNVEEFAVVAGNPAKFIKYRFNEKTRLRLAELAWWDWPDHEVARNMETLTSTPSNSSFQID